MGNSLEVTKSFSFHDVQELRKGFAGLEPLNRLKLAQSRDFLPFFERIMRLREAGRHTEAIALLQKEKQSLAPEVRLFLLFRLNAELGYKKKAAEFLAQAKEKGLPEIYCREEDFFQSLASDNFSGAEQLYAQIREITYCGEGLPESEYSLAVQIAGGLILRRNNEFCVEWLEYQRGLEECPEGVEPLFKKLVSSTFKDVYYSYYGWPILLFQIFAALLVLSIAAYHVQYLGEPCLALIRNMVSGVSDWSGFFLNLQKVLPPVFLFIALSPVLFINSLMLFFRFRGRLNCYTEVHENYIKVCDFGFIYHLAIRERDRHIYLYEDDNDYTYISLIRLLPFVPNLTYIYAWDYLRGFYCLVPLYGVADGSLFRRNYLHRTLCRVHSFNMFGVRLAQLATFLCKVSHSYLGAVPILLGGGVFLFGNIYYMMEANALMYFTVFFSLLLAVLLFFQFTRFCLLLLNMPVIGRLLRINIVRSGVMFLAVWYFSNHYQVYGFSGIIPVLLCSYGFYLLFVLTKYDHSEKQIVAEASAFGGSGAKEGLKYLHHNLHVLSLRDPDSRFSRAVTIFYNDHYIAIPVNFCGMTIYYDVTDRNSCRELKLQAGERGCTLEIGHKHLKINANADFVREKLENSGFTVTDFALSVRRLSFKLPFFRFGLVCALWLAWQYAWQMSGNEQISALKPDSSRFFSYLQKTNPFQKTEDGLYNKFEGIYWEKLLPADESVESISFQQSAVPSWGGMEASVVKSVSAGLWPAEDGSLPYFLRKDGFRDDVFNFLYWYGYLRWQTVDTVRYAGSYQSYCRNLGFGLLMVEDEPRCYFQADFARISAYASESSSLPEFIAEEELVKIFHHNGLLLEFATRDQQENYELVLAAVSRNGHALQFAAEHLKNNETIVRSALETDSSAFIHVGDNLRNSEFWSQLWSDKKYVLSAIAEDEQAFVHVSANLKKDRSFLLDCVRTNYAVASVMQEEGIGNQDFWREIVNLNKDTARWLPKKYRTDQIFMGQIVTDQPEVLVYNESWQYNQDFLVRCFLKNSRVLYWAAPYLKKDRAFMTRSIRNSPFAFIYADRVLRFDRSFVFAMMTEGRDIFPFLPPVFYSDPEIALLAVSFSNQHYFSLPKELAESRSFLTRALILQPSLYELLPSDFQDMTELLLDILSVNPDILRQLAPRYLQDINFAMPAVGRNGLSLQYFTEELRSDRQLVLLAVQNRVESFQFAADHLKTDVRFVLEVMRNGGVDGWKAFEYASGMLRSRHDFVLSAVQQSAWVLRYAAPKLQTNIEIVRAALKQDGLALQIMPEELRNNREMVEIAVSQNGWAIGYAGKKLAADAQIKALACKTTPLMAVCR
jgi:hypothetical protein